MKTALYFTDYLTTRLPYTVFSIKTIKKYLTRHFSCYIFASSDKDTSRTATLSVPEPFSRLICHNLCQGTVFVG